MCCQKLVFGWLAAWEHTMLQTFWYLFHLRTLSGQDPILYSNIWSLCNSIISCLNDQANKAWFTSTRGVYQYQYLTLSVTVLSSSGLMIGHLDCNDTFQDILLSIIPIPLGPNGSLFNWMRYKRTRFIRTKVYMDCTRNVLVMGFVFTKLGPFWVSAGLSKLTKH